MRRAARVDRNQADLIEAMRRLGAQVEPTHMIGRGFPDAVVGWMGRCILVEFKVGHEGLTLTEEVWHDEWNERGRPVEIIRDIGDVLELRKRLEREAWG